MNKIDISVQQILCLCHFLFVCVCVPSLDRERSCSRDKGNVSQNKTWLWRILENVHKHSDHCDSLLETSSETNKYCCWTSNWNRAHRAGLEIWWERGTIMWMTKMFRTWQGAADCSNVYFFSVKSFGDGSFWGSLVSGACPQSMA